MRCCGRSAAPRCARSAQELRRDLRDHVAGPQFLTIVAATAVVGVEATRFTHFSTLPGALWSLALGLWLLLTYAFLGVIVGERKPRLDEGLDGSWLLLTVSTESLAVLGTLVDETFPRSDVVVLAWRHARARTPLLYDAQYWSMVFPPGMYSSATYAYAHGNHLDFLLPLARIACALAVLTRLVTAAGLARRLLRRPTPTSVSR